MQFTLLNIRRRQILQEIKSLGLYLFLIIVIIIYIIIISYKQFEKGQNSIFIIVALTLICLSLQVTRKDKTFIYKHADQPHLQIFSEYLALTFPIAITSIFTSAWYCYPLLLLSLFLIPYLSFTVRKVTAFKNITSVIPASNFEWISGFRKIYPVFIGFYLLALATCKVRVLPLLILWFITVIILSFYSEGEPIEILRESGKVPKLLLFNKLILNYKCLVILYTPILLLNSLFNPDFIIINVLFIIIQISLITFAIFLKYSSYVPNKSQKGNSILISVIAFTGALPYFLPIPLILSVIYYFKAKSNLNHYLND